jgi:hypothetical protein
MKLTKSKLKQIIKEELMALAEERQDLHEFLPAIAAVASRFAPQIISGLAQGVGGALAAKATGSDEAGSRDDECPKGHTEVDGECVPDDQLEEAKWQQDASEDIEEKGHEGIFKKWCKDNDHGGVNQACINAAYKAGKPWKARAALAVTFSRGKGGAASLNYPKDSDLKKKD